MSRIKQWNSKFIKQVYFSESQVGLKNLCALHENFTSNLILRKIYLLYKFAISLLDPAHNGKYKLLARFYSLLIICNFFIKNKSFFQNRQRQSLYSKKMLNDAIQLEIFLRMLQKLCKMFILNIFSKILLKTINMNILNNFCSILKNISSWMASFSIFIKERLCRSLFRKKLLFFIKK